MRKIADRPEFLLESINANPALTVFIDHLKKKISEMSG